MRVPQKQKEPRKSELTYEELCTEVKQDSEGYFTQTIRYRIGFETKEWLLQAQSKDEKLVRDFAEYMRRRGCNVVIVPKREHFLMYINYSPTHGKDASKLVEGVEIK